MPCTFPKSMISFLHFRLGEGMTKELNTTKPINLLKSEVTPRTVAQLSVEPPSIHFYGLLEISRN